jgi:hypothetical protein
MAWDSVRGDSAGNEEGTDEATGGWGVGLFAKKKMDTNFDYISVLFSSFVSNYR